ncbi:MAG: CDP-diacylglycerol--glycerol-3-phosphate 3-phosphatidyltransferase [Clostridia bacterium]|nr:CDP-diacylglycerol--glycerol-3-phosphate 3-phosphatidyltransferase [Clostridia bacterium]
MNTPNKLTLARVIMVPFVMLFMVFDFGLGNYSILISLAIFILASLTDMLDGKIARKYNLITTFGKFMDPLADKFMVIATLVTMCAVSGNSIYGKFLLLSTAIVIFRELAVTSLRLVVVNADGVVIAANFYGKAKTVTQIAFIIIAMLETFMKNQLSIDLMRIPSYVLMAAMSFMTLMSGISYCKSYWKYISLK